MGDNGSVTLEQLIESAPEVINRTTLGSVKQLFELAKYQAENCSLGKMVDDLLLLGQSLDDVVDELAYGLKKGKIESKEYDDYVRKVMEFQFKTVTKTLKDTLTEKCKCGV